MIPSGHLLNRLFGLKPTPLLMGILNVTPDSFSDGNLFNSREQALAKAEAMIKDGADLLDIGGESTRPGSVEVEAQEELNRVIPIIEAIRQYSTVPISVDTRKAMVAKAAIKAGADIINDISALRHDAAMLSVLQENIDTGIILMHMSGDPATMQTNPHYVNVIAEITEFFTERIDFCLAAGINKERIMLDPGIGFGKNLEHNLTIMANLTEFSIFGLPVVLGASRKSFINQIVPSAPLERLGGTLAAAAVGMDSSVDLLRVHDVREHFQFIKITRAIQAKKQI
jgi:dihydropteroate synthase